MKKLVLGWMMGTLILLAGCSFDSSVEKMLSDTLSEMNDTEQEYQAAQAELTEIEKTEQQLFNETMKLSREHADELQANVTQLEEQHSKRLEILDTETKAMKKASSLTAHFDAILDKAEDPEKKELNKLRQALSDRYERHDEFLSSYTELAASQIELYSMLTEEETDYKKLEEQVHFVNALNEKVQSNVEAFNEATHKVNELKETVTERLQQDK